MSSERIELHFIGGGSDKVYNAELQEHGGGQYSVYFEYGRRNSTLNQGFKVQNVLYAKARKAYDGIINEKIAKGYQVVGNSTPSGITSGASVAPTKTVVKGEFEVQLLNAIDEEEVEKYIKDPKWGAQAKMDGERRPVAVVLDGSSMKLMGYNRKNQEVMIPQGIAADLFKLAAGQQVSLDGEIIGDTLYLFDAMKIADMDITKEGFGERFEMLPALFSKLIVPNIKLVSLAYTKEAKRAMFERIKADGGEGIVFKKLDAPYTAGRPNSKGNAIKFKFVESASFVVGAINDKRSVALQLFEKKGKPDAIDVGNVTILPNFPVPKVGDIVEVQYLYKFRGGSIFQPIFKGVRTDLTGDDCLVSQMKYKKQADFNDCESQKVVTAGKAYAW